MPFWTYLAAVPVLGLMMAVHELGHYLVARAHGIAVAEFSLGFGPKLWAFRKANTDWSLRLIPLIAYVRWHEEGDGAFADAPIRARARALVAGPMANLLLTFVALGVLYMAYYGGGWRSVAEAAADTVMLVGRWAAALAAMFAGGGIADLSGPVGIVQETAARVAAGPAEALFFVAIMSLNVGMFNLLPLPMLDGGRLILLALERIRNRPLRPEVEGWLHLSGFVLLLALACITVVKDLLA